MCRPDQTGRHHAKGLTPQPSTLTVSETPSAFIKNTSVTTKETTFSIGYYVGNNGPRRPVLTLIAFILIFILIPPFDYFILWLSC